MYMVSQDKITEGKNMKRRQTGNVHEEGIYFKEGVTRWTRDAHGVKWLGNGKNGSE